MAERSPPYAPEYRRQMVELVRTGAPFVVAPAHVGEHRRTFVQMALGEPALDAAPGARGSQSIASYRGVLAGITEVELFGASVVVCHSRVVASFEAGWSSRSTTMASTRSRSGERFGAMSRSRPRRRVMASRASTWPWGRERSMVKASSGGGEALALEHAAKGLDLSPRASR